jgi:hypothetical protein
MDWRVNDDNFLVVVGCGFERVVDLRGLRMMVRCFSVGWIDMFAVEVDKLACLAVGAIRLACATYSNFCPDAVSCRFCLHVFPSSKSEWTLALAQLESRPDTSEYDQPCGGTF